MRPTAFKTQLAPDPESGTVDTVHSPTGHLSALVGRLASGAEPVQLASSNMTSSVAVPMYTSLALAILRNKAVVVGRVWCILHHHFNRNGRQVVPESEIVDLVSSTSSPLRLFTARQWRNVKKLGEGIFWSSAGRGAGLLIHGTGRVSAGLGLDRLDVGKVKIPIAHLIRSTKSAKAALYASFDATRPSMPISRAAKENETGLTRINQWRLEQSSRLIDVQTNYELVTEKSNQAAVESALYTFGSACFDLTDHQGKHGQAGKQYLARQMPNTYTSTLTPANNGRRKKINRQLKDHVAIGARGERFERDFVRLYFDNSGEAIKAMREGSERVSYRAGIQSKFGFWCRVLGWK